MTASSLLKNLLHIKGAIVDTFDFGEDAQDEPLLVAHVHVCKKERWKCPVCGRKCHVHDYACGEAFWRSMDFGPVAVRIGIDETSYRKGHSYITIVVNHDTNTVVWAHKGHGKEVLDLFFSELSPEQRESILVVTGDGARWITDSVKKYCPNADRCVDPFHVVEWANDALDSVRLDSWRRARIALLDLQRKAREAKKSKADGQDGLRAEIKDAKKKVEELKNSKYALGKNEQNLTERQRERLSMIQSEDGPLARGHRLKERLKTVFALKDPDLAEEHLDRWIRSAQHCRIAAFVELQRKIRRHREHILNTIRFGLSNARIEATNNKIKLLLRIAYGFRNIDTMISLVMLFCSSIEIPWPGRKRNTPTNTGV